MINYDDNNIFNKNVRKCLTFDPFIHKNPEYNINITKLGKDAEKLKKVLHYLF
jgi:hypothetical protein